MVELVSAEIAVTRIRNYLKNTTVYTPFIVVVDDSVDYSGIIADLGTLQQMHLSRYCATDDSFPNNDTLCSALPAVTQNTLLLGLGENILLSGKEDVLGRIKDLLCVAKVIVVCRGVREAAKKLCSDDPKMNNRRVCFLKPGTFCEIIKVTSSLNVPAINGFKELLLRLENGASETLVVKTALSLQNAKEVVSAYEAVRLSEPTFNVPQACLPDECWAEFLANQNIEGYDLFHWRWFLKLKCEHPADVYLRYVIEKSANYDEYRKRIFNALLDFPPNDKRFPEMYIARKALLKGVKESDIAGYAAETKIKGSNRIYYLTDNTAEECQAVIESLDGVTTGIPTEIKNLYPRLHDYLNDFAFSGELGKLLTDYFADYKRLKVTNRITPEFYEQVRGLACDGSRPYNSLKTRGEVLDSLIKTNAILCWIDALGVEYLGYIQNRANSLGLKMEVHVVRANLPTITSFNRDFYDDWAGDKMQIKDLDDVKHRREKYFDYHQKMKIPIHLVEELDIIDKALEWMKTKLASKNADKVILVSDHGASRLTVINEQECKWEMISKGKHSGRCCPCDEADVKSEFATQERDFWVLANYDRFKGGHKASVEVHGGATLEEVVIPLIEIELNDNKIEIHNDTPITTASYKKKAEIILFSATILNGVSVRVNGKQYNAEAIGNNKHKIVLYDIKQGNYTADVFAGDNLIGQVEFEVQSESGKANDSDWF